MEKKLEQVIIQILCEKISPIFITLFGSRVSGSVHQESDLDIAFLTKTKIDRYDLFLLSQEIADAINIEVDLIDLSEASTVFKAQIIHTGRVIYCRDEQVRAEFEMRSYKMYARLNEERAPILKKIAESGSVYE